MRMARRQHPRHPPTNRRSTDQSTPPAAPRPSSPTNQPTTHRADVGPATRHSLPTPHAPHGRLRRPPPRRTRSASLARRRLRRPEDHRPSRYRAKRSFGRRRLGAPARSRCRTKPRPHSSASAAAASSRAPVRRHAQAGGRPRRSSCQALAASADRGVDSPPGCPWSNASQAGSAWVITQISSLNFLFERFA